MSVREIKRSVNQLAAQYDLPSVIIRWRIMHGWPIQWIGERTTPYSTDKPVQLKPGTLTMRGIVK